MSKSSNRFIAAILCSLNDFVSVCLTTELFVSVEPPCRLDLDEDDDEDDGGCCDDDDDFGLKILTQLNFFDQFVILLFDSLSFESLVSGLHFEHI